MFRRWLPAGGVLTAALAVLLLLPGTSSAQRWRTGWGGWGSGFGFNLGRVGFYYGSGSPFNSGYYPGYYSGYYGANYPFYGSTWYPRSYGGYRAYSPWYNRGWYSPSYSYGVYSPSYYSYPSAYSGYSPPSYYSFSYPSSYSSYPAGMTGSYASLDATPRGYYGATEDMGRSDQTVLIHTRVPPDAEVWFEGTRTQSTGVERDYISPPLQPGQDYVYNMRVRWMQDGQEVVKTRDLRVRAGDEISVDFLSEAPYGTGSGLGEPARGTVPSTSDRGFPRTPDSSLDRTAPGTDRTLDRTSPGTDRPLDRTEPGLDRSFDRTTPSTDRPLDRTTPGAERDLDRSPATTPRPGTTPSGTSGTNNPGRP